MSGLYRRERYDDIPHPRGNESAFILSSDSCSKFSDNSGKSKIQVFGALEIPTRQHHKRTNALELALNAGRPRSLPHSMAHSAHESAAIPLLGTGHDARPCQEFDLGVRGYWWPPYCGAVTGINPGQTNSKFWDSRPTLNRCREDAVNGLA